MSTTAPTRRQGGLLGAAALLSCLGISCLGCASLHKPSPFKPSNLRNWRPELAQLPSADIDGERIEIHNIRNCSYVSSDVYVVDHYDKQFDLGRLRTVDFVVVPFKESGALAHTLLSFGFTSPEAPDGDDTDYLAVSVEARLERGETYSPIKGAARQYELMYVIADERDVLGLRAKYRGNDVYVYRAKAPPEKVQAMFLDVLRRCNKLAKEPEFYDSLTNNCTSNIVQHVNQLVPGRIPWDPRVLLPGMSDQLAYDLGLLDNSVPFEELRRRSKVDERARVVADLPDFSQALRR